MTTDEAKLVLRAYRPGDDTPLVHEALAQAKRDPDLAAWLSEQHAFDQMMTRSLAQAPVPSHLKHSILHQRHFGSPLGQRKFAWALAAAVVLGATLFVMLHDRASRSIDDFRAAMVQELWTLDDQAKFRSPDVAQLRQWLKSHGSTADFTLPPGLDDMRVRDVRVVNWADHNVASLCLIGNGRHLHLFVVPTAAIANAPSGDLPEVENCKGLDVIAWTHGPNTYLLSGINCVSLIKNNRRAAASSFAG